MLYGILAGIHASAMGAALITAIAADAPALFGRAAVISLQVQQLARLASRCSPTFAEICRRRSSVLTAVNRLQP
jgi:hypothetical protein